MLARSAPRESILRDYLYEHPEVLFDRPVQRRDKEVHVEGKYVDLLFQVDDVHHIVELKRDSITREAVGQVLEYYGRLRYAHPDRSYRMVLVAPSIPKYRSIPLEEFGIRCVEVPFPGDRSDIVHLVAARAELSVAREIKAAIRRPIHLSEVDHFFVESAAFQDFLPPAQQFALRLGQKFLRDAIPSVQADFSEFEIMPLAMNRINNLDVLCLPSSTANGTLTLMQPGVWWAFAFGQSANLPKNDTPNISVNSLPWGLDFAVNAELRTSQRVVLQQVDLDPTGFDRRLAEHGHLALQTWLKLEHQPRFYHWIPLTFVPAGEWGSKSLLQTYAQLQSGFLTAKRHLLSSNSVLTTSLSDKQRAHMMIRNNEPNIAIRFVRTYGVNDAVWDKPYEAQLSDFSRQYAALKPLIAFFNGAAGSPRSTRVA